MSIDQDPGRRELTVLVIEDDPDEFTNLQICIKRSGFEGGLSWKIFTARTLDDAGDLIRNNEKIDVVLLDLDVPGSVGADSFDQIKEVTGTLPVVVLSGSDDHNLAMKLVNRGAQDYFPKKVLSPELIGRSLLYAMERASYQSQLAAYQDAVDQLDASLQCHQDEVSQLQLQLMQAEKLQSLGRLASGVAHEIKNPLAMLQMGIDFCKTRSNGSDETENKMLSMMREALQRADRIVVDMVDFARPRDIELGPQNLNNLTEQALTFVESEMKHHDIQLKLNLGKDLPDVRGDRRKIEQVLLNLFMNAIQASPVGGKIEVTTALVSLKDLITDPGQKSIHKIRTGQGILTVHVRDFGEGIPEDKLGQIFDPFFTSKPAGGGTGLGLSVSKTIVELHGGRIRIKNSEPRGVLAEVFLHPWRDAVSADNLQKD